MTVLLRRHPLDQFANVRANGLIAVNRLVENDSLIGVDITNGDNGIMLFSKSGKVVRFNEDKVRAMGRAASGVRV